MKHQQQQQSAITRFLGAVGRVASRLPDPALIFVVLALLTIIISAIASGFGVSVTHPGSGEEVAVRNLATAEGVRGMLGEAVHNFITFPPLGLVLAMVLGIGVAEQSGYITTALRLVTRFVSAKLVTPLLLFFGVMSSMAADAGYVVLIPLGAILYRSYGKHPIAGIAVTLAGVAGGFSANLFITSLDPLLAGLTESAAKMIAPDYEVLPTANYYVMIASVPLLVLSGTFVAKKITEPLLGIYEGNSEAEQTPEVSADEMKGFLAGSAFIVAFAGAVAGLTIPETALLRDEAGTIKPFFEALIPLLMLMFLGAGIIYGYLAKTIRSSADVARMAADSMATMGSFLVLSFAAAQFIAYFNSSNLGLVIAVKGAEALSQTGLAGTPLVIGFIALCGGINLLISSASAKWALMAPVFVPMLMLMGYSPEMTQLAYRIGDSSTNMIAPLMSYIPLLIAFVKKYDDEASLGTLLAMMLPYAVTFFLSWSAMLTLWLFLGIEIGPGAPVQFTPTI